VARRHKSNRRRSGTGKRNRDCPRNRREENDLEERLKAGEISEKEFARTYEAEVHGEKRKAMTRCFLEREGLSSEYHEDLFERWDDRNTPLSERSRREGEMERMIDEVGPEAVRELTDRMYEAGTISDKTYEAVDEKLKSTKNDRILLYSFP